MQCEDVNDSLVFAEVLKNQSLIVVRTGYNRVPVVDIAGHEKN